MERDGSKLMKVRGRRKKSIKRRRKKRGRKRKKGGCRTWRRDMSQLRGGRRPGDGCYGNRGTDAGDDGGVVMSQEQNRLAKEDKHVNVFFLHQTLHHLPR